MNKHAIYHKTKSNFCFATGRDEICLRLKVAKDDNIDSVAVIYGGKYDFSMIQNRQKMQRQFEDDLFAYYITTLKLTDLRLAYIFEIEVDDKICYLSEDGVSSHYDFVYNYYNSFQFPYINEIDIHNKVDWMSKAVFYHIFVDRFAKGNFTKDDSYIDLRVGDKPNPKSFGGGDLDGIRANLDYIKSLGANTVYLTPIFKSHSNHKYDIEDYFAVDQHFGDNQSFKKLVDTAHEKGMRIVIDAVFNHVSENLAEFQDVVKNGEESKYYDWFIIRDLAKKDFECFASCDYMPKLNTSNKEVQKFLMDIALFWIREYDIDGWRLDVSDEVSHNFWHELRTMVKDVKSDCVLIGENWHDAEVFLRGDQFDSVMNYAFTKACLDFFAFDNLGSKQMAERLSGLLMRNTDTANLMMLNLVDNHDTDRMLTVLGDNKNRFMCAIALMYFYVGSPCIYYGTEIALLGGYDPDNRRMFDWSKTKETGAIAHLIQILSELKKTNDAFSSSNIKLSSYSDMLVVERTLQQQTARLVINLSGYDKRYVTHNEDVLVSNCFSDHILQNDGFVIEHINL